MRRPARWWAPKDPREIDTWIAANVKARRESRGLSQLAVAEQMRERGHDWGQDTVWKVESGRRQVRVCELADLTEVVIGDEVAILSLDEQLDQPPAVHGRRMWAEKARNEVEAARAQIEEGTRMYLRAQFNEEQVIRVMTEKGDPGIPSYPDFESPELIALGARIYDKYLSEAKWTADDKSLQDEVEVRERVRLIKREFADLIDYPFDRPRWEDTPEGRELIGDDDEGAQS